MSLPQYRGAFPGTYQHADRQREDRLPPPLPRPAKEGPNVDVCRKGFYAPTKWESFENISAKNKNRFQASDHHCLWAEIQI